MLTEIQLENHQKFITGSKIASILNLPGAYCSKYELFAQMKGLAPWPDENERMKAGNYMEGAIAEWCEKEWNWRLIHGPKEGKFHSDYPFVYGLIDRLQLIKDRPANVIEIKNQDKFRKSAWEDAPPEIFKAQLYLYMSIFGLPGKFAVCFGGNDFEHYELPRHPKIESMILKKCYEFWEDLQRNRWPEPDNTESCAETLKILYNDPSKEMASGTQELLEIAEQYYIFSQNEKQAKENKMLAANRLRDAIGNKQGLIFSDGSKATWKKTVPKKEQFNEALFAQEHPDLYKKYLHLPEGYRRLHVSLKGIK